MFDKHGNRGGGAPTVRLKRTSSAARDLNRERKQTPCRIK